MAKRKRKEKRRSLVVELKPHNDGPSIVPNTVEIGQNRARVTREATRETETQRNNQPLPPPPVYNAQEYFKALNLDEEMDEEESNTVRPSQELDDSRRCRRGKQGMRLNIKGYNIYLKPDKSLSIFEDEQPHTHTAPSDQLYLPLLDTDVSPNAVRFDVEDNVYLFLPTESQYLRFSELLHLVKGVAGHYRGVAKIIVPSTWLYRHIADSPPPSTHTILPNIIQQPSFTKTATVRLSWARSPSNIVLYKFQAGPGEDRQLSDIMHNIRQAKQRTRDSRGIVGRFIWREIFLKTPFTELDMITASSSENSALSCANDQTASPELREVFGCGDLHIEAIPKNVLPESNTLHTGINKTAFHTSLDAGVMFPLRLGEFAAFSLNYLHRGAPRSYTVIRPQHHHMLEDLLRRVRNPPKNNMPQPCSRFISHMQVYVPEETLRSHNIDYTTVRQFKGEMVVIFPRAYYQGYNAGTNIVEEAEYADEEWKPFQDEALYKECNEKCDGRKETFDLSYHDEESTSKMPEVYENPGTACNNGGVNQMIDEASTYSRCSTLVADTQVDRGKSSGVDSSTGTREDMMDDRISASRKNNDMRGNIQESQPTPDTLEEEPKPQDHRSQEFDTPQDRVYRFEEPKPDSVDRMLLGDEHEQSGDMSTDALRARLLRGLQEVKDLVLTSLDTDDEEEKNDVIAMAQNFSNEFLDMTNGIISDRTGGSVAESSSQDSRMEYNSVTPSDRSNVVNTGLGSQTPPSSLPKPQTPSKKHQEPWTPLEKTYVGHLMHKLLEQEHHYRDTERKWIVISDWLLFRYSTDRSPGAVKNFWNDMDGLILVLMNEGPRSQIAWLLVCRLPLVGALLTLRIN